MIPQLDQRIYTNFLFPFRLVNNPTSKKETLVCPYSMNIFYFFERTPVNDFRILKF